MTYLDKELSIVVGIITVKQEAFHWIKMQPSLKTHVKRLLNKVCTEHLVWMGIINPRMFTAYILHYIK